MRRMHLLLLFVCCSLIVHGQSKPDYKQIEKVTKDASSPFYYPSLFARYLKDDTTLSLQEIYHLYYGYFFVDDKGAGSKEHYNDSIKAYKAKSSLTNDEKKRMIHFVKAGLQSSPYGLSYLNMLCILYHSLGDEGNYAVNRYKFRAIVENILATGDGRSEETGFHVLTVADEYTVLSALGFKSISQKLTDSKCDYLKLEDNDQGIAGLYFDVKQIFEEYTRIFSPDSKNNAGK